MPLAENNLKPLGKLVKRASLACFVLGYLWGADLGRFQLAQASDPRQPIEKEPDVADFFAVGKQSVPTLSNYRPTLVTPGDPSFEAFARGCECAEMRSGDEALKWFDQALKLNPRDAEALSARAAAYIFKDDLKRALKDLDQSIKLAPQMMKSYSRRGYVYLALGRREEGIRDLTRVIESDWVDPIDQMPHSDLLNRSKAYRAKGMLKEAARDAALAEKYALLEKLQAFRIQFKLKEAKQTGDEAVKQLPESSYANLLGGVSALNFASYREAFDRFSKVISKHPDCSFAYYFRADAARGLKKFAQAQSDYDKILSLKPRYVAMSYTAATGKSAGSKTQIDCQPVLLSDIYFLKGLAYEQAGDLVKAVNCLETYVKMRPEDREGYFELANFLVKQNKLSQAEQYCLKAQKIKVTDADTRMQGQQVLLEIYRRQGKDRQAIAVADEMVVKDPDNVEAYFVRAQLYQSLKDFPKALAEFNQIIKLDKSMAEGFAGRAEVNRILGRKAEALADFRRAASLDRAYKQALRDFELKLK